jgi:prenyltransferase beta subunit
MLFWKLFFSSLAIIVSANIVGQVIIIFIKRRQAKPHGLGGRNSLT